MTKTKFNYLHFKLRIKQRFDINISKKEYRSLIQQVKAGKSICLDHQTNHRSIHQVKLRDLKLIIAYNNSTHNPVTVLFPGKRYKLI